MMDTNSEEWRAECEIREILRMDAEQRTEFYLLVKEHRGESAARVLIAAVNAERRRLAGVTSQSGLFE